MKLFVEHYRTATGKIPYLQWLTKLKDRTAKAAVIRRSIRIELGDMGDHKIIGDGVSELRIDVGQGWVPGLLRDSWHDSRAAAHRRRQRIAEPRYRAGKGLLE